jgi:hypothetical protein
VNHFEQVATRARRRCEYCRLPADFYPAPFQIDHIIARQHGGDSSLGNLAFACIRCNRHKGPNIAGIDPLSGRIEPLFHPRQQNWRDHFRWQGAQLHGLTPIGRATVRTLNSNAPEAVELRNELRASGVRF